jgi:myo-inositol-1(or 4)-monophosphatase
MNEEFSGFARLLARESGRLIADRFGRESLDVSQKADATLVTEADRAAEQRMRALIRERYPEHGILGEEFGSLDPDAEYVWSLDPIDGTISFVAGCPLFGTLIGLLRRGEPILGVIHQPLLGQLCIGDGTRTWVNDRPVHVSDADDLSSARLLTTDMKYVGEHQDRAAFDELVRRTGLFRTWGDCYGYLLVASGGADIMLDPIVNPWDVIPLIPIIRGAGGVITSWDGGDPIAGRSVVASNPALHPLVIGTLNASGRT